MNKRIFDSHFYTFILLEFEIFIDVLLNFILELFVIRFLSPCKVYNRAYIEEKDSQYNEHDKM